MVRIKERQRYNNISREFSKQKLLTSPFRFPDARKIVLEVICEPQQEHVSEFGRQGWGPLEASFWFLGVLPVILAGIFL